MIKKRSDILRISAYYILLTAGAIVMIFPFVWMVLTSLKEESKVFLFPPQWIPDPVRWENYSEALSRLPFFTGLFNSVYITVVVTAGVLFLCSLAAYAFAKIKFRFKEPIFLLYLLTMMVPSQITLIPQFILFTKIGWIDTHWGLIIPAMITNGFGVFLLRQFFSSIPDALIESAKIDGCNHFIIFTRIMLAQVKPALASLAIFTIIARWNDFLTPFILLVSPEKFTLPLVIKVLEGFFASQWALMMAAATMSLLPILVVYIFTQRYFVEGIALSGIKG